MRRVLAFGLLAFAVAAAPTMAKRPSPPLRGVVEGYYGRPWTGDARRDVIAFMGAHGLDTFVYGPKNDDYHRDRWRDLYPDDAIADFRETAKAAKRARVKFVVALSPAKDICYACKDDFKALTRKLAQIKRAGVRHFALFYDDVFGGLTRPEDIARYGGEDQESLARAHADLTNRTDRWLRSHGLPGLVLMVPSDYAGTECHPYHDQLGRKLRPKIAIGWTGSGVFTPELMGAQARAFRTCVADRPIVLWDNFPVNDGIISSNLHLGPLTGRDADLTRAVRGHLFNPMTQAHATLVGLGTAAAYFADPDGYDPEVAWQATLAELDPSGGLAILAEQTRSSPLDLTDAVALGAAVDGVAATFADGDWQEPMETLIGEIIRQLGAPPTIEANLGGTPLGDEIAPWVAELGAHMQAESQAVAFLRALKPDLLNVQTDVTGGMLHVTGRATEPDTTVQANLVPLFGIPPTVATAPELVECLGGLDGILSGDIPFCPELGLNVHGKALYVVPYSLTVIETITGKNVHQRFLELVAARWADFQSRQSPGSTALTLMLDGAPVPLAPDGSFDVTVPLPADGTATLVVTTAAGDATSRVVP